MGGNLRIFPKEGSNLKKFMVWISVVLFYLSLQTYTMADIFFPEVPRITAYEAYQKVKRGNAILIQAGGEDYRRRHIMGAYDLHVERLKAGEISFPTFPKKRIEIIIYCY